MDKRLEKLYTKLQNQRAELLNLLQNVEPELLSKSPAPGKWSVLQILNHLYVSEKISIGYVKKKSIAINDVGNTGLWQSALMIVLKISQRIPIRYKAPKVVLQNTSNVTSITDLLAQWNLLRIELKSMLTNLPENHINKLVYKHPFAGRLSLPQALEFFSEHIIHHTPQIKRILKK